MDALEVMQWQDTIADIDKIASDLMGAAEANELIDMVADFDLIARTLEVGGNNMPIAYNFCEMARDLTKAADRMSNLVERMRLN